MINVQRVEIGQAREQMVLDVLKLIISLGLSAGLMIWAVDRMDPTRMQRKQRALQDKVLRLRVRNRSLTLTDQERWIATEIVAPFEISTSLADIGGLASCKRTLHNKVINPLKRPDLFSSSLLRQSRGVLLYGPPGTGKTMLAKALARESGAIFLNIKGSTVLSKWYGESARLVHAIFSLAAKLQPCIVFLDEVDSLLGKRGGGLDHDATTSIKTEFMQLWDGLLTDKRANVMVLGATNRPQDLDDAVLRRFTTQLEVGMPSAADREKILRLLLTQHVLESGAGSVASSLLSTAHPGQGPLAAIGKDTEGFTGSDLKELLSNAAAIPTQELLEREGQSEAVLRPRPIGFNDLRLAAANHKPFRSGARAFQASERAAGRDADRGVRVQIAHEVRLQGRTGHFAAADIPQGQEVGNGLAENGNGVEVVDELGLD